jgi:hypothetical protein
MLNGDMGACQSDITSCHLERGVAEDVLQCEHITACDEVGSREGVPEEMGVEPGDPGLVTQSDKLRSLYLRLSEEPQQASHIVPRAPVTAPQTVHDFHRPGQR